MLKHSHAIWVDLFRRFLLRDYLLLTAVHGLFTDSVARFIPSLDHSFVLICNHLMHLFLEQLCLLQAVHLALVLLDLVDLSLVFSALASHVTNVLNHRTFDLVEQLECGLAVDFTASDPIFNMDVLNLVAERVQ